MDLSGHFCPERGVNHSPCVQCSILITACNVTKDMVLPIQTSFEPEDGQPSYQHQNRNMKTDYRMMPLLRGCDPRASYIVLNWVPVRKRKNMSLRGDNVGGRLPSVCAVYLEPRDLHGRFQKTQRYQPHPSAPLLSKEEC